jgi:hypothetical protein
LVLNTEDVATLDREASGIPIQGARMPPAVLAMTGR